MTEFNNNKRDSYDGQGRDIADYGIQYMLANVDDSAFPRYYGYLDALGGYYILREVVSGSCAYYKASFNSRGGYSQAWAQRATLTYMPWDTSF